LGIRKTRKKKKKKEGRFMDENKKNPRRKN
jgi:hypothetical protein